MVNIGVHDYFKLSTLGIKLTSENEKEMIASLKGATYKNGKVTGIIGDFVTFYYRKEKKLGYVASF